VNIIDFWRRWHMTLSRFLRDYLYFPLGGNRKGPVRRYVNLMVTMLLGGLWHGAAWTFVAWGALHGLLLSLNHAWRALRARFAPGPRWLRAGERSLGAVLTFVAVFAAWVLFRAEDFESARLILSGMAGLNGLVVPLPWLAEIGAAVKWAVAHGLAGFIGWLPERLLHVTAEMGGVIVEGVTGGVLVSKAQVAWIAALLLIAWLAPNTRQLMERAEAIIEDRRAERRPAPLTWRPSPTWAMFTAVLLTASFLGMARVSEFLYFQF